MAYGTLSSLDTLLSIRQSVLQFGEDRAWESIQIALDAHNAQLADMLGSLVERTTDTRRAYGTGDTKTFDEVDQYGQPDVQKITAGIAVDFPLRRYVNNVQWTRQWLMTNSVAQMVAEINAILDGDRQNVIKQIKRAIFNPTNTSFVDRLGNPANITLNLKAFLNADSAAVPVGPNGETFDGTTHTHYLANATLTTAAATSLIVAVQEHANTGIPQIFISSADEAAWRALSGFQAYIDPRMTLNANANQPFIRSNISNIYNRAIGLYGNAQISIKPWMVAGYAFGYIEGQPAPLAMRLPQLNPDLGDLQPVFDDERYPLRSRTWERQMGVSVWQRQLGAVLDFGHSSYTAPSI